MLSADQSIGLLSVVDYYCREVIKLWSACKKKDCIMFNAPSIIVTSEIKL